MKGLKPVWGFLLLTLAACHSTEPFYHGETAQNWQDAAKLPTAADNPVDYRVFLIGDAGEPKLDGQDAVFSLLQSKLTAAGDQSAVVFLGDNIYPRGLPPKDDTLERQAAEARIDAQLNILKDYNGHITFLPGNHDHNKSGRGGHKFVKRQEKYVEKHLDRGNTFLPDHACPGPEEVELSDNVTLLVLDSEWWLTKTKKSKDCEIKTEQEVITALQDALKRNKDKKIILAMHHPMRTLGPHAGNFPLKDHLFPLREANESLWIPFPIIGTIYPAGRKFLGHPQDIAHPRYQTYVENIEAALEGYNVVIAAGHEHSLQYFEEGDLDYIVSGAGSKSTHLAKRKSATFGHQAKGFAELQYYRNGEVWMIMWEPGQEGGKVVFRHQIETAARQQEVNAREEVPAPPKVSYADSTVRMTSSDLYEAGGLKRLFFGSQYRDTWGTEVEVPVLDVHYIKGGLTPLRKGGGQQTKSLRFDAADGKQYVVRSIDKYPISAVPKILRKTIAADVVQDQISMAHPFGATLVPKLADAAQVYHTNPQVMVVPDDPIFGQYQDEFKGMMVLFEERPAGDQSDRPNFGNSDKLVNSLKVYDKIHEDHDNRVDAQWLMKSRLFDIFLNDWDRHEDQWRWARFKKDGGWLFQPIPRDRDQVFVKFEGLLPGIANRKWGLRKFQSFDHMTRDIAGLCFNARYVDRNFLSELSLEDWLKTAREMQKRLTDEVIRSAIKDLPPAHYELEGETIVSKLRSRRDNLPTMAEQYYRVLAKEIEIVGSDKREYFEVKRLNDEETEITVYKRKKKGGKGDQLYKRVIKTSETREVRLFGLDGKDKFHLTGDVKKGIIVRVIGGAGKDEIINESRVRGWMKKTKVYDKEKKTKLEAEHDTRDYRTDNDPEINDYNRKSFVYNYLGPLAYFGYNKDDGVFVGGGFTQRNYGFRREPYKYSQNLTANYAVGTGAFNFNHQLDFRRAFGRWDFQSEVTGRVPSSVTSYFGLGNETERLVDDVDFNRIRIRNVEVYPALKRGSRDGRHLFSIGPDYQHYDVERTEDRFVTSPESGLTESDFEAQNWLGAKTQYRFDNVDKHSNPKRGLRFDLSSGWKQDLEETGNNYWNITSSLAGYVTLRNWPLEPTIALRVGGATNIGEYEFFQANVLGGTGNLGAPQQMRGLRRNRYAGTSTFYSNNELRFKLFKVNNPILPFDLGMYGFYDLGRVWLEDEESDVWHYGTGGGVWLSPIDIVVLTASYAVSDDDEILNIKFGFLF